MNIFVYDTNLNLIHVVDTFSSFIWNRKYNSVGTFELHVPLTSENIEYLKIDNIICKEHDDEGAIIESREITLDNTGEEVLTIKGRFLGAYLSYRINKTIYNQYDTPYGLMINLVKNNIISTTYRVHPNIMLNPNQQTIEGTKARYQNSYGNILDEVEGIAKESGLGFKVTLHFGTILDETGLDVGLGDKHIFYTIYEGVDRTVNQSTIAPVIFAREYENIISEVYTENKQDYKNTAYVFGEGEGSDRKSTIINNNLNGIERREVYIDARDLQQSTKDTTYTDAEYQELLIQRGKQKLEDYVKIETFEGVINTLGNNKYRIDYDLGDIITIRDSKLNLTLDTRITEIQEVYENGKIEINPTFGNVIPTIYDKLRKI